MSLEQLKKPKVYTQKQALIKAESYCAYQERCQQEVRDKLYSWGLHEIQVENVIADLIASNFINEERFAKAYAGGKFRIKKWGRVKISIELKRRKISTYCIKKGLAEIEEEEYIKTLQKVAEVKIKAMKERDSKKKKYKVMNYLLSRGFENDLVVEVVGTKAKG
ncbi:MAG: RecX family transcriptional regulator [Flavobacteriales bacterium]|nr:MAG: RecX family transcriptional regulator [Flavobacteriales bacterium]